MCGIHHAPLRAYMDSLSGSTGVPYLGHSEVPGIDDRNWFADHNHLNTACAPIIASQPFDTLEPRDYLKRPIQ